MVSDPKEACHRWRRSAVRDRSTILFLPPSLGACGKTSLLCSFALGEFPKEYVSLHSPFHLLSLITSEATKLVPTGFSLTDSPERPEHSYFRKLRRRNQAGRQTCAIGAVGYRVCIKPLEAD